MAKILADQFAISSVKSYLQLHPEFSYLRARRYADLIILESGPEDDPFPHARFRRDTIHLWRLEMPSRGGKVWERTPFRASLIELFDKLVKQFPWTLMSPFDDRPRI